MYTKLVSAVKIQPFEFKWFVKVDNHDKQFHKFSVCYGVTVHDASLDEQVDGAKVFIVGEVACGEWKMMQCGTECWEPGKQIIPVTNA